MKLDIAVLKATSVSQADLLATKHTLIMWLISLTLAGQLLPLILHRIGQ